MDNRLVFFSRTNLYLCLIVAACLLNGCAALSIYERWTAQPIYDHRWNDVGTDYDLSKVKILHVEREGDDVILTCDFPEASDRHIVYTIKEETHIEYIKMSFTALPRADGAAEESVRTFRVANPKNTAIFLAYGNLLCTAYDPFVEARKHREPMRNE